MFHHDSARLLNLNEMYHHIPHILQIWHLQAITCFGFWKEKPLLQIRTSNITWIRFSWCTTTSTIFSRFCTFRLLHVSVFTNFFGRKNLYFKSGHQISVEPDFCQKLSLPSLVLGQNKEYINSLTWIFQGPNMLCELA